MERSPLNWVRLCLLMVMIALAILPPAASAAIPHQQDDPKTQAEALFEEGQALFQTGQFAAAIEKYEAALPLYQTADDRHGEALCLLAIGSARKQLADYLGALDAYEASLPMWEEVGGQAGKWAILIIIGETYGHLSKYQRALDCYQQALSIAEEIDDQTGKWAALTSLGALYHSVGQLESALDHYEQALAIVRGNGDRTESTTLGGIAAVHQALDQDQQALDYYQQALAISKRIGDRPGEMTTLVGIGAIEHFQGLHQQAADRYDQALSIARDIGDVTGEAMILTAVGFLYSSVGLYEQAMEAHLRALEIDRLIDSRMEEGQTLANIGELYENQGDAVQAIARYQESIEILESVQGEIKIEELKASFASEQVDAYGRLINLLWKEDHSKEAFKYAERARARAFLDQIGNQRVDFRRGAAPELIEQEQAWRQQIIGLQNALSTERGQPLEQQRQLLLDEVSKELEQARRDYQELLTRLKLASPEYASLVSVNAFTLEEVQSQVLDGHTTLIEYFVLDEQTLAWVISQDGFELVSLDITSDGLRNQVAFLVKLIKGRDFDEQTAARLYDTLFAPLKPYIRHHNLVLVPHGVLHYLPFAALWDAENERYLIEEYALTYAPSASVLKFILDKRNADEGRLLALGDPDGSLPHAATEVKAVADLYGISPLLGQQARESQVYTQSGQWDLLHLAAHGVYNPFNPLFTRIELAADDAHDGNLEVHEVFGLDLTGANLVVLSACETALGEQSAGDELVGLTRAFLYAGTPAVVTTLWPIDDQASGVLMEAFYHGLRDGLTNAEALRAAQLAVLAQEKWRTPYTWAAFGLTGDYQGNGPPGALPQPMAKPLVAAATQTPASVPPTEAAATPAATSRRGICGAAVLPVGLVVLAVMLRRRVVYDRIS